MKKKAFAAFSGPHVAAFLAFVLAMLLGGTASAAELRVFSPNALHPVLDQVIGEFEKTSGHKVNVLYDNAGAIAKRVRGGETADMIITSVTLLAALEQEGKIQAGSATPVARTGVGIVVRAGAPKMRIATAEDFKRALLAAKTVTYADPAGGGAAGIHVAAVIEKMGIAGQLKPKLRLGKGGDVAAVTLAQGEGAIGMTQISEIVGKPGADFVGPLPEEIQNYTVFAAGIGTGSKQGAPGNAFIKFLKGSSAAAAMKAKGMQPG
jgi:molybdate transport system substrate-binding protein